MNLLCYFLHDTALLGCAVKTKREIAKTKMTRVLLIWEQAKKTFGEYITEIYASQVFAKKSNVLTQCTW